jgi:hypothetical protein
MRKPTPAVGCNGKNEKKTYGRIGIPNQYSLLKAFIFVEQSCLRTNKIFSFYLSLSLPSIFCHSREILSIDLNDV